MEVRQKIVNRNRIRNSPIMNNSLGLQKKTPVINFDNCDISDEDVSIRDEEKCCVCGDFEPRLCEINLTLNLWSGHNVLSVVIGFISLICVPEKVVRKDMKVVCPHCKQQWKLRNIVLYFLISCWLFNIDNYLNCILYSNHQLHTSLKSHKKLVNMPSIRI